MNTNKDVVKGIFADRFLAVVPEDAAKIAKVIREHQKRTGFGMTGPQLCIALFGTGDERHDQGLAAKHQAFLSSLVHDGQLPGIRIDRGPSGGFVSADIPRFTRSVSGVINAVRTFAAKELADVRKAIKEMTTAFPGGVPVAVLAIKLDKYQKDSKEADLGYIQDAISQMPEYKVNRGLVKPAEEADAGPKLAKTG